MAFIHKHNGDNWIKQYNSYNKNKYIILKVNDKGVITSVIGEIKDESDAKLVAVAPKLLQCTEMLHDYLLGKDSIILEIVKNVLIEAGVEIKK